MDIEQRKQNLYEKLKIGEKEKRIEEIQRQMASPDFWREREKAQQITAELSQLNNIVRHFKGVETEGELEKLELQATFTGEYDEQPALLSIHAGAGGTESQDWAEMLLRMYERFSQNQGFQYQVLEVSSGEEAGVKSATIKITGPYAFGILKGEAGVHRLVRLSPFDADHARHTSFALVEIVPEIKEADQVEIKPDEIRVDVYRSRGHGGQGVNTTDSAVRITHLLTKIVVSCQNERSQLQNKATAMKVLVSRLVALQKAQHVAEIRQIRGEVQSAAWGNQIRSYVLHPYKMVKDHRTGFESSNPDKVLNGELMPFIEAWQKWNKEKC
jgi:peptide chain release factor 2